MIKRARPHEKTLWTTGTMVNTAVRTGKIVLYNNTLNSKYNMEACPRRLCVTK